MPDAAARRRSIDAGVADATRRTRKKMHPRATGAPCGTKKTGLFEVKAFPVDDRQGRPASERRHAVNHITLPVGAHTRRGSSTARSASTRRLTEQDHRQPRDPHRRDPMKRALLVTLHPARLAARRSRTPTSASSSPVRRRCSRSSPRSSRAGSQSTATIVQPTSLEPDAINTLIDCFVIEDGLCASAWSTSARAAPAIVFARIEVTPTDDGTRDITLSGYWLVKGHDAVAERRNASAAPRRACARRRRSDARARRRAADRKSAGRDDDRVARRPSRKPMPSGMTAMPPPQADESHTSKLVPITITAVGGVALVGGIVMIATRRPAEQHDATQLSRLPHARLRGRPSAGVVAAGVGLYLLLRPDATSAPVAAIESRWRGRRLDRPLLAHAFPGDS